MITLAFAQMLFYLANSVKGYGGDEGLNIRARSLHRFRPRPEEPDDLLLRRAGGAGGLPVGAGALRAVALRPRGAGAARRRASAPRRSGLPTFAASWLVFVVAGVLGGIAGALSVNQQGYVSPNVLHWTQSGTLMVMVILGGVGHAVGRRARRRGAAAAAGGAVRLHAALGVLDRLGAAGRGAVRAPGAGRRAAQPVSGSR